MDVPLSFSTPRGLDMSGSVAAEPVEMEGTEDDQPGSGSQNERDPPVPLDQSIRGFMVNVGGEDNSKFLPASELEELITAKNVSRELHRIQLSGDIQTVTTKVLEEGPAVNGESATRKKIFALLCLMDKVRWIVNFIQEGIYDFELPFRFENGGIYRKFGARIFLFDEWKHHDHFTFEHMQGQVIAPYFKFNLITGDTYSQYSLHKDVVLPFIEEATEQSVYGDRLIGGTSEVRKVRIHSAHYEHTGSAIPQTMAYFAIKMIHNMEAAEGPPTREMDAYRRLNPKQHPHIVRLLASYHHKRRRHLIFPWADGNLFHFWRVGYPERNSPSRGSALAKWLIGQFLGLSQALVCIHDLTSENPSPGDYNKKHGRHGDLKPENILWFRSPSNPNSTESWGTLQISDLGSTEFHDTISQNVRASKVGHHPETYKAPEFDKMQEVSPKADIWSFGCVLLEFIVWFASGYQGVEDFSTARKDDSNLLVPGDHFYDYHKADQAVSVKKSVSDQFQSIHDLATSDLIVDLAAFIESRILLADPSERATCQEIETRFARLQRLCNASDDYCTRRTIRPPVRSSTGGSNKVPVSLSAEQLAAYDENLRDSASHRALSITPSAYENDMISASGGTFSTHSTQQIVEKDKVVGPLRGERPTLRARFPERMRRIIESCFKADIF
ncbi:unnamed protein product [Periconia digitata]|uniref:Protein kinase domain-containing protein n=1 Tax=Periconia digitata TaxID=1303443 RepID=A0A9W4XLD0_9PLEO|nr:unnamed protein product [Periconia digitata]